MRIPTSASVRISACDDRWDVLFPIMSLQAVQITGQPAQYIEAGYTLLDFFKTVMSGRWSYRQR